MPDRTTWKERRDRRLHAPAAAAAYEHARVGYEIGRQVRALREGDGVSQSELARRIGTTQSVIARLEAGRTRPSLTTLERVATALSATVRIQFEHTDLATS